MNLLHGGHSVDFPEHPAAVVQCDELAHRKALTAWVGSERAQIADSTQADNAARLDGREMKRRVPRRGSRIRLPATLNAAHGTRSAAYWAL